MLFYKISATAKIQSAVIVIAAVSLALSLTAYRKANATVKTADSLREEIPLFIGYDEQLVTPYINITINNKTYKALFDTGSSGLRILSGAISGQASDTINQRVRYGYGDEKRAIYLRGKVMAAPMQFGGLKTAGPIRLMSIDSARYGPDAPWTSTGDSALISSGHFRGLPAIIGVGLRLTAAGKDVASPLAQLPGSGIFIVEFPGFGKKKGKVIINPKPEDAEGFTFFHLSSGKAKQPGGYSSWLDDQLYGCVNVNGRNACLPTMLDCGAPDIMVYSENFAVNQSVPPGNNVTLEVRDKLDPTVSVKDIINVSDNRRHGRDYIHLEKSKATGRNLFGVRMFFDYDILYDARHGLIGLRKK